MPHHPKTAVYLDSNAASPLSPAVKKSLQDFANLSKWDDVGNPSSIHMLGRKARSMVEDARDAVARSIGERAFERIVLCSSGTEANQQVIRSAGSEGSHWVTTTIEHASILELREEWPNVSTVPVSSLGQWTVDDVLAAIRPETKVISVGWVNNETGVIQPVEELRLELMRAKSEALLHIDAAQAWGKIPVSIKDWKGRVALTASGHKIGSLGGVGFIWTSPGTRLKPLITGSQERGLRGGTENLLGIASMGWAAGAIDLAAYTGAIAPLRDELETAVKTRFDATIHGGGAVRVANTSCFVLPKFQGDSLVLALDLEGYCVSSGSACSSGLRKPSHVLLAMGLSADVSKSSIRVSLSRETTADELSGFVAALQRIAP